MTSDRHILLHMSLIDGVGPALIERVMNIKKISFDELYSFSIRDMMRHTQITKRQATLLVQGLQDKALLHDELERIERTQVVVVTILDDEYPSLLKNIHMPPPVLYRQGHPLRDMHAVAIVGSRQGQQYAKDVIQSMVPSLVHCGFSIISGGARGVDAYAHEATVQMHGVTVGVLGSGLLRPYPVEHKRLFQRMIEAGGTLLSPFPLTMQPFPGNFPARNRVIAGMSKACIVVQAAEKSGARITAMHALEQGRDVFAVPGPIFDPLSIGCHQLIMQGATLLHTVDQVLQALGQTPCPKEVSQTVEKVSISQPQTSEEKIKYACRQPCSFDELQEITTLSFVELNDILFNLQLSGEIFQNNVGLWQGL